VLTVTIGMFRFLLRLPIPILPLGTGLILRWRDNGHLQLCRRGLAELVGNLGLGMASHCRSRTSACAFWLHDRHLIGVLPGVGPIATITMLLPITFGIDPTGALIMLAGIYYGPGTALTTAILVNIPEATSVVTTLDGHQMAKQAVPAWRSASPPSARSSPAACRP
jgi:hypothetical protein